MSRKFSYLTVKTILEGLESEGVKITRVNFYRLEKRLRFPVAKRTSAKLKWRVYTREQVEEIKSKIKEEYNIKQEEAAGNVVLRIYNLTIPNKPDDYTDSCEAESKELAAEIFAQKINASLNEDAWSVKDLIQYIS